MLIAIVPLIVAILGAFLYVLASNTKAIEIGRALMWCGLLVTLFVVAKHTWKFG